MGAMDTKSEEMTRLSVRVKISLLWIVVVVNVIFADIFSFMLSADPEVEVAQVVMLVFAFVMEIPIAMIFLSRALKYKVNRWANIIAAIITILFVIAGGSAYLHYYFFAAVEIICMLIIIRDSWIWDGEDA